MLVTLGWALGPLGGPWALHAQVLFMVIYFLIFEHACDFRVGPGPLGGPRALHAQVLFKVIPSRDLCTWLLL